MAENPLSEDQVRQIRSMAVYWREVREREDTSPLDMEAATIYQLIGGKRGLLRLVEFAASPEVEAAPDLYAAVERLLSSLSAICECDCDYCDCGEDEDCAFARAALRKARGEGGAA